MALVLAVLAFFVAGWAFGGGVVFIIASGHKEVGVVLAVITWFVGMIGACALLMRGGA